MSFHDKVVAIFGAGGGPLGVLEGTGAEDLGAFFPRVAGVEEEGFMLTCSKKVNRA